MQMSRKTLDEAVALAHSLTDNPPESLTDPRVEPFLTAAEDVGASLFRDPRAVAYSEMEPVIRALEDRFGDQSELPR